MQENDSCVASLLSNCSVPEADRKSNDKNYEVKNLNDKLHAVNDLSNSVALPLESTPT